MNYRIKGNQMEISIPEEYGAFFRDGKIIIERRIESTGLRNGDKYYEVFFPSMALSGSSHRYFHVVDKEFKVSLNNLAQNCWNAGFAFLNKEEAESFCNKLNNAITPIINEIIDKRKKEFLNNLSIELKEQNNE